MNTMSQNQGPKGSFVRWQSRTIDQLTYSVNLILGLAVAALGFEVSTLLNKKIQPVGCQKCAFDASLVLLLLSVLLGLWCVINRLKSFRATMKTARLREKGEDDVEIRPYRDLYRRLDKRTWPLFWWQIGTFGAGILFAIMAMGAILSVKLL